MAFPPKARAAIYWVYTALGLILGAVQVYYAATGMEQPDWMVGVLAVFAFLGSGFGFTAASHTQTSPPADA